MQHMALGGAVQLTVDSAQGSTCLFYILLSPQTLDRGSESGLGETVSLPGDGCLAQTLYR